MPKDAKWPLRIIAMIFIVQILFAFVIAPLLKIDDFFPLHRWALFGKVTKVTRIPIPYIHSWNGRDLPEPQNYYDYFRGAQGFDFLAGRDRLMLWHDFTMAGDLERASNEFAAFQTHFFGKSQVKFTIQIESVDKVEYLIERRSRNIETVYGPFEYNGGS